jgi:hypothetical protein
VAHSASNSSLRLRPVFRLTRACGATCFQSPPTS